MAQNVPGPVAVARLVRRGARAIKIEPPSGDPLAGLCRSWYDELHRDVVVERLDLKSPDGKARMHAMLHAADLLIASHRPAALARLGLDAATVTREHPTLRHLNIVGEMADPERAGHDLTYLAQYGLLRDAVPLTLIADMVGAERAYTAAIELLHEPAGSSRVVGLADAIRDLAAPLRHGLTAPGGPLGGGNPAYAVYRASEGSIAVAALEPHFRARLYALLGVDDGGDLGAAFLTRTAADWESWARQHDLPLVAVREG